MTQPSAFIPDEALLSAARGWRRQLHQQPELGYHEATTSDFVAECLQSWGYRVTRGLGGTGVVGQWVQGDGSGPRVGLRADMDALPIQEATGLPYASARPGVMHACGHDGHVAMLLGAARQLAATHRFHGTLNLIFQPAEEGLAGAQRMIDDGLFSQFPCDAVFALHNMPGVPLGRMLFRAGPMMASSDMLAVRLTGPGGHAAHPQRAADPMVAAAACILGLQTLVSRNLHPMQMGVVTVSTIQGGRADNVLADEVVFRVNVRALDRDVRSLLLRRVRELVEHQAASFGVGASVQHEPVYPVLVNTAAETALACAAARAALGDEAVEAQADARVGSEDFAFMLDHCPGSYALIGAGDEPGRAMIHQAHYDFNDALLSPGIRYWVALAERFLARPAADEERGAPSTPHGA